MNLEYHAYLHYTTLLQTSFIHVPLQVATVGADTLAYTAEGLTDSADYFVRVFSENKAGISKRGCELDDPVKARAPISKSSRPGDVSLD